MIENQLCHAQIISEELFGRGTMKVQPDHRQDDFQPALQLPGAVLLITFCSSSGE